MNPWNRLYYGLVHPHARQLRGEACADSGSAATRAASPAKLRFPWFVACDGFRWDDFGKWKVYVVKGKMSQAVLRAVFIAKAFPGR